MELEYVEIGKRIRKIRKQLNLTQEQFSEWVDITPEYLSRVERGDANISFRLLSKISDALDVSMIILLGGTTRDKNFKLAEFDDILPHLNAKNRQLLYEIAQSILKSQE